MVKLAFLVCVLSLVALLPPPSVFAQQQRIDSLETLLETSRRNGATLRGVMLELAELLTCPNPDRAKALAQKALRTSAEANDIPNEIEARSRLGRLAMLDCQPVLSRRWYQSCLRVAKRRAYLPGTVEAMIGFAMLSNRKSNRIDLLEKAIRLGERLGYERGVARASHSLSWSVTGRVALAYAHRSARWYRAHGHQEMLGRSLFRIGQLYYDDLRHLDSAHAALVMAVPLLQGIRGECSRTQLAACLNLTGTVCIARGLDAEALSYFEAALEEFRPLNDSVGQAGAMINIGHCLRIGRRDSLAVVSYNRGLEIARGCGHTGFAINALDGLSKIYRYNGDFRRAFDLTRNRLDMAERLDPARSQQTEQIISAYLDLGRILQLQNRNDSALTYFEWALERSASSQRQPFIVHALLAIGDVHFSSRAYEQAKGYYLQALEKAEERSDLTRSASLMRHIGDCYKAEFRYSEAIEWYERSLKHSGAVSLTQDYLEMVGRIAEVCSEAGDTARALSYLNEGLKLATEQGNDIACASMLQNLAIVHLDRGQCGIADRYISRSIDLTMHAQDTLRLPWKLNVKGQVLAKRGEFEEAIAVYARAMDLFRLLGNPNGIAAAAINAAECHNNMGRFLEATALLEMGTAKAREAHNPKFLGNGYFQLSRAAAGRGDFPSAYEYHLRWASVNDSLRELGNLRQRESVVSSFEAKLREQRIGILENERKLDAFELSRQRDALLLKELEAAHERQRHLLLSEQMRISALELNGNRTKLALAGTQLRLQSEQQKRQEQSIAYLSKEKEWRTLEATAANRIRDLLLLLVGLIVVIVYLVIRRLQGRKRNALIRAEVAEARALAARAESETREKEVRALYARRLIETQEQEKRRLAAELHDGLGQELLVIGSQADLAAMDVDILRARETLTRIAEMTRTVIAELRDVSRSLRPVQLERAGVTETLNDIVGQFPVATGITLQSEIERIDGLLPADAGIHLLRIVQESLSNVIKHSHADTVSLRIRSTNDGHLVMRIEDNGCGFDPEALSAGQLRGFGFGLHGMKERVGILHGSFSIESREGAGTRIEIRLPISTPDPVRMQVALEEA